MSDNGGKSLVTKTLITLAVSSSSFVLLALVVPIIAPNSTLARYLKSIRRFLASLVCSSSSKKIQPQARSQTQTQTQIQAQVQTRAAVVVEEKNVTIAVAAAEIPAAIVAEAKSDPIAIEETSTQDQVEIARVGKVAPSFTTNAIIHEDISTISLEDYRGKYLVLFFYPLDFTFVCPTEIIEFSEKVEAFRAIGCEVLGVSVDSVYAHLAWVKTARRDGGIGHVNFPLVSDLTHSISKSYGAYLEDAGHSLRATFILNQDGVVRHLSMNDPPVGRSVDEVLRLVQAYQHVDEVGEVCPAGWNRPGDATIKPDPKDKIEYFGQVNQ